MMKSGLFKLNARNALKVFAVDLPGHRHNASVKLTGLQLEFSSVVSLFLNGPCAAIIVNHNSTTCCHFVLLESKQQKRQKNFIVLQKQVSAKLITKSKSNFNLTV